MVAEDASVTGADAGCSSTEDLADLPLTELARVCWQGTALARRAVHESHGRLHCPTRRAPYGNADPAGTSINPSCFADDCLDIYHDVLATVKRRLEQRWAHGGAPIDPVRYAASTVATVLVDRQRAQRVAKGLPAKPGRADGTAAVVNAHLLAAAPDRSTGEWHVALFRILRNYANSEGRASASWPVEGLTQEKVKYSLASNSIGAADSEVRADIQYVLAAAQRAVGREWLHQVIWHPLLAAVLPASVPPDLLAPGSDLEDQVLTRWFHEQYVSQRRNGLSVKEAFKAAARVVRGEAPPDPGPEELSLLEDLSTLRTFT